MTLPIRIPPSSELLEETQVVLEEQPQVRDAVLEHLDPLRTHAEGEALVPLGIEPAVLEDDGVDHPGTEDGHPAAPATGRAAGAPAHQTLDVERDGRFGERVVARAEARPLVGAIHRLGELVEEPLEVAHRGPLVDHYPLDLEELRRMRGIDRLVPIAAPGQEHA